MLSCLFPSTITEVIKIAQVRLQLWAANNGLGVSPSKMEVKLFTSKTKILQFHLLLLIGATIFLSDTAKYLSVEIDSKQNCEMNNKNRNNKAFTIYYLYICKDIFSRNLDLKLYILIWTYKAVTRPISIYEVLLWWSALKK